MSRLLIDFVCPWHLVFPWLCLMWYAVCSYHLQLRWYSSFVWGNINAVLATIIKQILWQQAKTGINGVLEKQLIERIESARSQISLFFNLSFLGLAKVEVETQWKKYFENTGLLSVVPTSIIEVSYHNKLRNWYIGINSLNITSSVFRMRRWAILEVTFKGWPAAGAMLLPVTSSCTTSCELVKAPRLPGQTQNFKSE